MTSPKRLGKYELLARLGQGGMAEVWKGFDPQLQRLVAIKFLHANLRSDPDFTNRFIREGQAIAALRHPNIVQVYDFQVSSPDDENPMAYMVMDYIEGLTLADYLRRTSYAKHIPLGDEILRLFTSLGLAVDYAHQHRMIHRDIKPANILLDTRNTMHNAMGEPILTDFGIVKILGGAAITNTGISMGTPLYISPEMVHGQAGNEKSDIYALGVILYELCTGEPPYLGDNPYVILAQRITRPPDPPSQRNPTISPALDEVILRCLAMDPVERFASASELTASLAEAFGLPIPDVVRHTLSLRHQAVTVTSDLVCPGQSVVETPPIIAPGIVIPPVANKSEVSINGSETILTPIDTGVLSLPQHSAQRETPQASIGNQITGVSAFPSSSHQVTLLPFSTTVPVTHAVPAAPPQARQRNRRFLWGRILLLVVFVSVGMGISTYAFLRNTSSRTQLARVVSVGNAIFVSSGQFDSQNTAFMNDGIQVHLDHVPNPAPGNRYYAWIQGQNHAGVAASIFLGVLQDYRGNATLSYIDSQHRNLLASVSRFLVTEQVATPLPNDPSRDRAVWRYSATIPQVLSSIDHMSYLDHLRHLLVFEPGTEQFQSHHGIDFWLLKNIQATYINAIEVKENGNQQAVRQLLVNLLSYLDGPCAHQELGSTLARKVLVDAMIARASSIPLLDCMAQVSQQGYLTRMAYDLNAMINAPGVPSSEARQVESVKSYVKVLREHLGLMRADVLQMLKLDDDHLQQDQVLRNDLVSQGSAVTSGYFNPLAQTLQPGVEQICDEITFLAHFTVLPYRAA